MVYEMTGTMKLIMEPMTFNSGFTKREFVLRVEDGRYPQEIKFQCVRDHVHALDAYKPGDTVRVQFEVRGKAWNEKYFVDLEAVAMEKLDGDGSSVTMDGPVPPSDDDMPAADAPVDPVDPVDNFADDDLPF
ncbi:MAG: DUF3127 domain-containing protein [Kiritimatiellia bacterium]|jgi:single-strand DNA-binding protein